MVRLVSQIVTHRAWPQSDLIHSIRQNIRYWRTVTPIDPRIRFGRRLVTLRKLRGWSQEQLALESGLARSYLGGVERGQRNIALLNIIRLADALDRKPGELLDFQEDSVAAERG